MGRSAGRRDRQACHGKLVICADDFGMSEGVSRTIVDLARAGKLNAISCMTISPRWDVDALLLRQVPDAVEIGLHLVLSQERPLTEMPCLAPNGELPSADRLLWLALSRRLPERELAREIKAQFDRFEQTLGRPPSFIDGHQHTHVLPTIRKLVLEETVRRSPKAWVRSCEDRLGRILKRPFRVKALINALQSFGLYSAAAKAGLRSNDSFAGLYDFRSPFEPLLSRFLEPAGQFHLLICHPGGGEPGADEIRFARRREANALRALPVAHLARERGLHFEIGDET